MKRTASRGFTLIEVLVAIAILGVGLTAILAAQSGTFVNISHARNISQATGLMRCKMSEIEDDLQTNGFEQNDVIEGAGPCCDKSDNFKMTCKWTIEHPHFPEAKIGMGDVDAKQDLGANAGGPTTPGGGVSGTNALAAAMHGTTELPQSGNIGEMAQALTANGTNPLDAATSMLMSVAYPEIQQVFENGTRKITVTVVWNEGKVAFTNDLVEWYTDARASGVVSESPDQANADPNDPSSSSTGSGTSKAQCKSSKDCPKGQSCVGGVCK
jgi:general secretion pathway protein I